MPAIDEFIERYSRELDYCQEASRLVAQKLEENLRGSGVRCIISYRAKAIDRLEQKCAQRQEEKGVVYSSVQEIYADIIDLAGVRVALYFPAEKDQVERAILRLFDQRRNPKRFPEEGRKRKGRIFRGYSADHYRISLKPQSLRKPQKRFAEALVEVQVASVLMHYIARPNAADQYQEKPRGRPRRAAPLATPWRVTAAPPSGTTGRRCGVVGRLVTSGRWAWV